MLALLRIPVIFIYFIIVNLLLILLCIFRPFHRNNVHIAGYLYSGMARLVGLKLDVRVPESVKRGGPYVYICNHQNSFDLITVCRAAQRGVVTVGKKSLIWIPVFGQVYWLTGNIMIDRKNSAKARDTIKLTAEKIREKKLSVWFFPEGTRSYGRGLLPFKTGAFRIAKLTNEPVVTISASNLSGKVKLNRWNNGTVIIDIDDPIAMNDSKDIKEWAGFFHARMKQRIEMIDQEVAQIDGAN
ncbi:1-acylglycerol-3-phosphate O-acyltransferase [Alteromonadaceae bacterium M269]|nr:1-acylglycerol-3-phosphate O-acyltransferase [Alteromonadaceae bacterium M269]